MNSPRRPGTSAANESKRNDTHVLGSYAPMSVELKNAYERLIRIHQPQLVQQTFPPVADTRIDDFLRELAKEFSLTEEVVSDLRFLRQFEIVILCDDSGSMDTPIDNTERTRWDELRDIVKIVLLIGTIFNRKGIDVYFLNRPPVLKVTDPAEIDEAFRDKPREYSNLAGALEYIFGLDIAKPRRDKKLLVFVATDAEPTNEHDKEDLSSLEEVMRHKRLSETTHVMFLLCNDNEECVKLLSKWDQEMEHVDVLDDYQTEREKVHRQNRDEYSFSYGEYILKALLGAINCKWDSLGE